MSAETLTTVQRQVFEQLIEGKSNKEIANALCRSAGTVRVHVCDLLEKFNCDTRAKLIVRHYKGEL